MGKSRSATVCIAYLLHQQRDVPSFTPQAALELVREGRPLCEPNDGFMQQLELYHQMGCPDNLADQPAYQRWLYRREVEESVACGRAPEMGSVRFEDEQTAKPSQASQASDGREVEIKCRKCRFVFCPKLKVHWSVTKPRKLIFKWYPAVEGSPQASTSLPTRKKSARMPRPIQILIVLTSSYTP